VDEPHKQLRLFILYSEDASGAENNKIKGMKDHQAEKRFLIFMQCSVQKAVRP